MSKVDLHLHSKYSDRSAEWLLRRFDFPDSCSEPKKLYELLMKRGMSFFTLTDHNRIEGCLELAHLPKVFVSTEATATFPEDQQKVHLLIWNITEAQFAMIDELRENIYELQAYLAEQEIVHAVAHPLFTVSQPVTAAQLEKLVLLFPIFEGLNGLRDARLSQLARELLESLTPEQVERFANRHHLQPTHPEPWKKIFTGGSDDHGGLFGATAWTESKPAVSPKAFLEEVRRGEVRPQGKGGSPISLSHSLYNTLYTFATGKYAEKTGRPTAQLLETAFSRFMEGKNPTQFSLSEKLNIIGQGILSGKIFELAKPANASLWRELSESLQRHDVQNRLDAETRKATEPEERAFAIANLLANRLIFHFFNKFVRQISSGNLMESWQALSAMAPVGLLLSPYLYALQSQAPSRKWMRTLCEEFAGEVPAWLRNDKRAWFTDTLEDVNGVSTTIRKMTTAGEAAGKDLVVVTSHNFSEPPDFPLKNFEPIGEFELPEYELQKLSFPPMLEILEYIRREGFSELIISTPGPVGLIALLGARMFGLRTVGIYHTDFPQYVRILTDDSFLETLTWNFMHWFYDQLDLFYVNSEEYRRSWMDRNIRSEKIEILPRGLDTELFHPDRRDPDFWREWSDGKDEIGLLYVGRISREKDLDLLARAVRVLEKEGLPVRLYLVGDGPYLSELRKQLPTACFTGYLRGEKLATAYASADIFAFPSTTDTFGNVVIEAQASGLPTVVSDEGGPKELVEHDVDGLITKSRDLRAFTEALRKLVLNVELRRTMGERGRQKVQNRNWANAFERFWSNSPV